MSDAFPEPTQYLDDLDWKILRTYDRDPFLSYNAISKSVGVHHSTVSDRIDAMKDRAILKKDTVMRDPRLDTSGKYIHVPRETSEVIGAYSPVKLGLNRVNVLFKRFKSSRDLNLMKRFCDDHPYTHYRTQLYGHGVNLFVQFDIPPETLDIHLDTFRSIQGDYLDFDSIEIFKDSYEAKADIDFETQVKQSKRDIMDPKSNYFEKLWEEFMETRSENITLDLPERVASFDNLDAELIREISINAKVNISSLTDYYNRDKSTLSRRMAKIRKNFVSNAFLRYDYNADKLHGFRNTQIVTGKFTGENSLTKENFIKFINNKSSLPFHAFVVVEGDRFFLYTQTTVGITGDLMQFLYNNSDPYELNQYQYYLSRSGVFPYWYGNYDENTGYNTSKAYIMEEPLEQFKSNLDKFN